MILIVINIDCCDEVGFVVLLCCSFGVYMVGCRVVMCIIEELNSLCSCDLVDFGISCYDILVLVNDVCRKVVVKFLVV